jgi:hypothetical protein
MDNVADLFLKACHLGISNPRFQCCAVCFVTFLSSQKVTKKDLTARTRSGSFVGTEFAYAQTAGR